MLDATVVIPTYNRRRIIEKVLERFLHQKDVEENYEIVVIDDGSDDETDLLFKSLEDSNLYRSISKSRTDLVLKCRSGSLKSIFQSSIPAENHLINPRINYIKIKKSGRSTARNVGIEVSGSDLIIFSDDDIFVEDYYVSKHISSHYPGDRLVVMGRVINTDNLSDPFSARWKLRDINTAFLSTGNASVRKEYLYDAGLFDENYTVYGWEDFDLGVHLKEIGLRSVKKAIYGYHYNPLGVDIDPANLYEKERERGITAVYFYKNHPLPWVKRFTMVNNRFLPVIVKVLSSVFLRNYLKSIKSRNFNNNQKIGSVSPSVSPLKRFLIRYMGYFEGIREGKKRYL